jgi:hypothetical protein
MQRPNGKGRQMQVGRLRNTGEMEYLQDKACNTHRLFPIVTTSPSGNSYNFSSANDWDAIAVPAQSREQCNTASP